MPVSANNIQSLLDDLISSHETEINYSPLKIKLPSQLNEEDIARLINFVKQPRKRLFEFDIPDNLAATTKLHNCARQAILEQHAKAMLEKTSTEPKINPLKKSLDVNNAAGRISIQIQKAFPVPKQIASPRRRQSIIEERTITPVNLVFVPPHFPALPELDKQLAALNIVKVQDSAAMLIQQNTHAFSDGIIPDNLPKGFYIDYKQQALCYTNTPQRLPTNLAPSLEIPDSLTPVTLEEAQELVPSLNVEKLNELLDSSNPELQKNTLISVLPLYGSEVRKMLLQLRPEELGFIVPLLVQLLITGGETHTALFARQLNACLRKKISLNFLSNPQAQEAFLNPRGIKNLQKLISLSSEQQDWWNTLANAHLINPEHYFDFNSYFEAYTQYFLPVITEKKLTLPHPCPIEHKGHFLITLNRVLDVLQNAQNPQQQCLALTKLNWGSTGVHFAMTHPEERLRLKQVAECMSLNNSEDVHNDPQLMFETLEQAECSLIPWLYRYLGQHWKANILQSDIQTQLDEIQKIADWTPIEKNQLTFILVTTFANASPLTAQQGSMSLKNSIALLKQQSPQQRSVILQTFSQCFQFKPLPSFAKVHELMQLCIDLKTSYPESNFIHPFSTLLRTNGLEVYDALLERIELTHPNIEDKINAHRAILSFINTIQAHSPLDTHISKLIAKTDEPYISETSINGLLAALSNLQTNKSPPFYQLVLRTFSQLNCLKSQPLPTLSQIQKLIKVLADTPEAQIVSPRLKMMEQEVRLKEYIFENQLLPGCVFGNGDISKLDDLLVDALVDSVKKRSVLLDLNKLKQNLKKEIDGSIIPIPQQLKAQLEEELYPMLDAVHNLFVMLQQPDPSFAKIIEKLRYFEQRKITLFRAKYSFFGCGSTGEFLLSLLTTGKKKPNDNITNGLVTNALYVVYKGLISQIRDFFSKPSTKDLVKDLDADTCISWMEKFNENQSITFFFKEDIIAKRVLPALQKMLQQLNLNDAAFQKSILDAASEIAERAPSDIALQEYKNKIEGIAKYLDLFADIKDKNPLFFNTLYRKLNTGELTRLSYPQQQSLLNQMYKPESPESLTQFLDLLSEILEDNPNADNNAIERAKDGLVELFKLSDLDDDTQIMFFKMSTKHNLNYSSPFPLPSLNQLLKSSIPDDAKPLITKQITHILSQMNQEGSADLINSLIQQTQTSLTTHPNLAELCIVLLKRVSAKTLNNDLGAYPGILQQLSLLNDEHRSQLTAVLKHVAENKKDDRVDLSALLELTKGLARRTADIHTVLHLFDTPPYPLIQTLNTALLEHGSEKLQAYCSNFDKNPFISAGKKRNLAAQFTSNRIEDALLNLQDLLKEEPLPHELQLKLARQLVYIETLGYTDPLDVHNFEGLKKLTDQTRDELQTRAFTLTRTLRDNAAIDRPAHEVELEQLELLALLREIYFRTTGIFPNSTQILVLLLACIDPKSNLLKRIRTGEGKSINTPMLSVLQWTLGGTVVQFTANPNLLIRDYENSCEPFYKFLKIDSALIDSNSKPHEYKKNGINCSTIEDLAFFNLISKELNPEQVPDDNKEEDLTHVVIDECDDVLLDQTLLCKLVEEQNTTQNNNAQWIYPLAYQFINQPAFRNLDISKGAVWDEEEDVAQFRIFIAKAINEQFNGDADKQNFLMATTNTQLLQWIHSSCKAEGLVENKHYIVKNSKTHDAEGRETGRKHICVPLIRSTPKEGAIFTEGVHSALQARLNAEHRAHSRDNTDYFVIDSSSKVFASQSARGLIESFLKTKGRLIGISGTPGDNVELKYLETLLGIQAIGVAPYAGDKRINHAPIFVSSDEEYYQAIHASIDSVIKPITAPLMQIDPDASLQTYEEREAFVNQTKIEIEKWSHTQTRSILMISETFDDAKKIGESLSKYANAGFKIQIVTGKETPDELDRIIKQAGQANTITVGTAMLAKGIDINIGEHPNGLKVIQTYTDSERMSRQIAGRAARNGKPGEWQPIYRINPPDDILNKILFFIFPWYKQKCNEQVVEELTNKIKLQMTVERLYTQAIDEAQHTVMQQIHAWESLLREIFPEDLSLPYKLYEWRETILSELDRLQETNLTQQNLQPSISQFKNSAVKLWENARENYWAAKILDNDSLKANQKLRLEFLKQMDLGQEFIQQAPLRAKSKQLNSASQALMHQNLRTTILDKAGAVLYYTYPTGEEKQLLLQAQSKQLLPSLIGEFCGIYPSAIKKLIVKNQTASFLPDINLPKIITNVIDRVIEQKDKLLLKPTEREQLSHSVVHYFEEDLQNADAEKISQLLVRFKPIFIGYAKSLEQSSLVEQFKLQGLVLTFSTLYQNAGLDPDVELDELKDSYHQHIIKKLADHLKDEFSWVKKSPQLYYAFLERSVAKNAAKTIYDLAKRVSNNPDNEQLIHEFYQALQEQKVNLADKYLFSIGHKSPRTVINDALTAIDSLNVSPYCEANFREECHDSVLANHYLEQFRSDLKTRSPYFRAFYDPVWDDLKAKLDVMSQKRCENQSYLLQELYEATARFSTYKLYKPYINQLNALGKNLSSALNAIQKTGGFKLDSEQLLFDKKAIQLAQSFKVNSDAVHIQRGTDGLQSFIEVQIKGEQTPSTEGFTRYQSKFFSELKKETKALKRDKQALNNNQQILLDLTDDLAIQCLPKEKHAAFNELFDFKKLLSQEWTHEIRSQLISLPDDALRTKLTHIQQLEAMDWVDNPVNINALKTILEKDLDPIFSQTLLELNTLNSPLLAVQAQLTEAQRLLGESKNAVIDLQETVLVTSRNLKESTTLKERVALGLKLGLCNVQLINAKMQVPKKTKIVENLQTQVRQHEEQIKQSLCVDNKKERFVTVLLQQAKSLLHNYLLRTSKLHLEDVQRDHHKTATTISEIRAKEFKKSEYQTHRFFSLGELLSFEAKLKKEELLYSPVSRASAPTMEPC